MKNDFHNTIDILRTVLGNFWSISRWTIVLIALVACFSSIASVSAPYVFSRLIDRLADKTWTTIIPYTFIVYAILVGLSAALQYIAQYLSVMSSENLSFVAATSFFVRLLKKRVSFFVDYNPVEVQSALARGQQALNVIVRLGLIVFIPGVTQIALTLSVLGAAVSSTVVAVVFAYGSVFVVLTYSANKWSRPHLDAAISATQENAKFVGNAINGMETLRHLGADRWMRERFSGKAREVFDNWKHFCLQRVTYAAAYGIALAIQFAITSALLLPQYRAGALTVGDIVLFNALLLQLNRPFEMIGGAIDDIVQSFSRFLPFARMWSAPEEPELAANRGFDFVKGKLAFENVSYVYECRRGVERINFEANRGQITYVTGKTGSGKSTVFRLALKSLEPQGGRITIDGTDLRDVSRIAWSARIGVVPQDVMLLNDTLMTNIVLGREFDERRLRSAVEKAAISHFIDALPDGLETQVGERGLKLSGGERQRVAIARALYAEPRILFLDEASSALDEATERGIMNNVRSIATEVTVVAITHRTSIIWPEDKIVLLNDDQNGPVDVEDVRLRS
jgi:ATP-binding cassette, subfamily B, bacterial